MQLLAAYERTLGYHSVIAAELALDSVGGDPSETLRTLITRLSKFRHQRGYLIREGNMVYFENCTSGVALKAYTRARKLPGGEFGDDHVRIEFTLNQKPAVTRHLGGNQLNDLLTADPHRFLQRNLRLEQVDYDALGRVLGIKQSNWRKVMLMIRHLCLLQENAG